MKKQILVIILFFSYACAPSFKSKFEDRVIIKEVSDSSIKVECYTFTSSHSESPFYVIAYKDKLIDTICISSNAIDLRLDGNTIFVKFKGIPKLYDKPVNIKESVFNYTVTVESIIKEPKFGRACFIYCILRDEWEKNECVLPVVRRKSSPIFKIQLNDFFTVQDIVLQRKVDKRAIF